ncbi:MAG TPA: hypothetical protein VFP72_14510 [Kineosporiaceae bacterium]|nr:hypothetical protein [Kineosporiaceae bacterium]
MPDQLTDAQRKLLRVIHERTTHGGTVYAKDFPRGRSGLIGPTATNPQSDLAFIQALNWTTLSGLQRAGLVTVGRYIDAADFPTYQGDPNPRHLRRSGGHRVDITDAGRASLGVEMTAGAHG